MRCQCSSALFLAVSSCLVASDAVRADPVSVADGRNHDDARRAFQQGQIRSLSAIMAELRPDLGGEVIEVELKTRRGAYYYKFKLLSSSGHVGEISVDAVTGKIIKRE